MKEFLYFNTKCPKCGLDIRDIDYKPPSTEYKIGIFNETTQRHTDEYSMGEPIMEYLLRTCCRCDYKWQEKCTDSKKENASNTVRIEGELEESNDGRSFLEYPNSGQDEVAGAKMGYEYSLQISKSAISMVQNYESFADSWI